MTDNVKLLTNIQPFSGNVKAGGGNLLKIIAIGDIQGYCNDHDGNVKCIKIPNVKYVPGLNYNLYSIPQVMKRGFFIHSEGTDKIIVSNPNNSLKLQFTIPADRNLPLMTISSEPPAVDCCVAQVKSVNVNHLHKQLGHLNFRDTLLTAKENNINVFGKIQDCQSCLKAKFKTKSIPRISSSIAT